MEHLGHGGLGLGRGGFGHADPDQSGLKAGSSLKIDVNKISLFVEVAYYPLLSKNIVSSEMLFTPLVIIDNVAFIGWRILE